MEFLKNYWYPLALTSEISGSKPYKITLLGDPLVLFRNNDGRVICLHDSCPHQGAPLSLGKVNQDGNLVCAYHGWQFGEGGECKKIPSIFEDSKIPRSAKCRFAYPTEEHLGVVWVFAGDAADVTPLRLPQGCTEDGWVHDIIVRTPEVPHKIMIAGAVDFAHFPFVHTNSIASKKQRQYLRPLEVELEEYDHGMSLMVKETNGEFNDFVYSFEPPCLVKVSIEPKPGWRLIASDYFVPLTENTTKLFIFEARDWLTWNPLVSWQLRRKANKILDEDLPIMVAQTERHASGDGDWNSSVRADLLCIRYRQWYDRESKKFANKTPDSSAKPVERESLTTPI